MAQLLLFQGHSETTGVEYEYVVIDAHNLSNDEIFEEYDETPVEKIDLDTHDVSMWPTGRTLGA